MPSTRSYVLQPLLALTAIALAVVLFGAALTVFQPHSVPCSTLGTGPMPKHISTCYEPDGD